MLNKKELTEVYDFVEVGTADFETLIQSCDDETLGLSIEAIDFYLERLPDRARVTKLNAAMVDEGAPAEMDVYYVPSEIVYENNFGTWLKGCNSVGKPHDLHLTYYPDPKAWHEGGPMRWAPINLVERGYVKTKKVQTITFSEMITRFKIKRIKYLKTDTEGYDPKILNSMLDFYEQNNMVDSLPEQIYFEWNKHCDPDELIELEKRLISFEYEVGIKEPDDIHNRLATLKTK